MYQTARAACNPRLSADDSTDDESSPQPPSLSIRPGGGVLGELEAEVMVTIDPTL